MYKADPTPGDFDHRGMDCHEHGENVPHARARSTLGPFRCVRCLLGAASRLFAGWPARAGDEL